ncbi:NUDIX domain-containing protein [Candidatus Saccharibacteria bacterium]|nr:NUDIX domain-containing protein [Candidatus Saccharibacteria bacterium]MCB9821692.1 NUDIX domain-containing protein [Candidatus Nomurabacteria bacterium]
MVKRPKPFKEFKKFVKRHRPAIQDVLKESRSGGIVYRISKSGDIEFLLFQDARGRWSIPKGSLEEGERPKETARREVHEETGLDINDLETQDYLGINNFRYRRENSLVLIRMKVYLVKASGNTDKIKGEDWMMGVRWFKAKDALDNIEYDDIQKLMLIAIKKIKENHHVKEKN